MDKETELKIQELTNNINSIITKNGVLTSGMGILADNTKKMVETLDKIQKLLYFAEKRQDEMFKWMQSNLSR